MIVIDKEQIKKRQQIYNLKTLLFTENAASKNLKSKIAELKSIFKLIEKIIQEKINLIESSKTDKNKNEIKKQVCNEIKSITSIYDNKNIKIINHQNKEKKSIREKLNQIKLILKDTHYYELKDNKDLIIQIIQEKKDLHTQIVNSLKDQKDIFFLFQQKFYFHFNNIFEVKMINLFGDKKYDEEILKIKDKSNHSKKYLKKTGEKTITKLKDELDKRKILFDKYIEEKGFNFQFNNNHYKEEYDIEIEVMNKSINSSDTSFESDNNSEEENSSLSNNDFLYMNNNKNFMEKRDSRERKIKSDQKQKKNSYPFTFNRNLKYFKEEEKKIRQFKSLDTEGNVNNDENINLINKLVEIKEKYNQLINEKYELDYKKKKMEKKIKAIKTKIANIKSNSSTKT